MIGRFTEVLLDLSPTVMILGYIGKSPAEEPYVRIGR